MRALGLALALAGCGAAPPPPPSVLIVTLDTTRADVMGVYGHPAGATPAFDDLAAHGVAFDRAYAVTPLTIPSHSSLFTGLYPPRHGVRDNGDFVLGPDAVTLAERLKLVGYATMASVGAEVTSHHWGFAQGFDAYFDDMGRRDDEPNRWRVERPGDQVVEDALGWLQGRQGPWMAWVHLFDAHDPYEPVEPFRSRFAGRAYLGEVASVDAQVARLIDGVDLERTLVVVLADHGEGLGDHGEGMHGTLLYDATTRIPLVVRPPGGVPARWATEPVSTVDVVPTVLAAVGQPVPEGLDGADLGPALRGQPLGEREVLVESLYAFHHYGWAPQRALVTPTHKLIDSTTDELYAASDVGERSDLAASEPAVRDAMAARVEARYAAMQPASVSTAAASSGERISQLAALGYVTGTVQADATAALPDPVKRLPVLRDLEDARRALRADDPVRARPLLERLLAAEPGLEEPRLSLARLDLTEGRLDEARTAITSLLAERPSVNATLLAASLELALDNPEQALARYREAIELEPYHAEAWRSYLHVMAILGAPALGGESARGRALLPEDPVIGGFGGVALAEAGDVPRAEPLLVDALERAPGAPMIRFALGRVRRLQGRTDEAEVQLTDEIGMFPPAIPARRLLVEIYAEQSRYAEQLAQLQAIEAIEDPNALTAHSKAQVLFNLGRYDEAETEVDLCVGLAPEYPACHMLRANVLERLGRAAEARAAYERALAIAASLRTP